MADNTIKGLNVEFGLDASSFNKGLSQINKELKTVATLNKQLDKQISITFDPEDLTLFNKRLDLTGLELKGTESKAEALKKEMKKLEDSGEIDTTQYIKLTNELSKAEVNTELLRKEQKRLNQDIEALNTKKYDELSDKTKNVATRTGKLTKEQVGYSESLKKTNTKGFSNDLNKNANASQNSGGQLTKLTGYVKKFKSPVVLATSALAVFTFGLKIMGEEAKKEQEAIRTLSLSYDLTSSSLDNVIKDTRRYAQATGKELSEAVELTDQAIVLYGDSIGYNITQMEAMSRTEALLKTNTLAVEEGLSILNVTQNVFNEDLETGNRIISRSVDAFKKYGKAGDDIADSYREFGDTFDALGFSAEEFFDTLEIGLITGARNTDEISNSYNEFFLRISEGTDDTKEAIKELGLEYEDVVDAIDSGNGKDAVQSVVESISEMDNATDQIVISGQLFGTYGEEFVATLAGNEEAMGSINTAFDIYEGRQKAVNDLTKEAPQYLKEYCNEIGLTSIEVDTLSTKFEENGFFALESEDKISILRATILGLGEDAPITIEQLELFKTGLDTLTGTGELTNEQLSIMDRTLGTLNEKGLILPETYEILSNALTTASEGGFQTAVDKINELADSEQTLTDNTQLYQSRLEEKLNVMGIADEVVESSTGKVNGLAYETNQVTIAEKGFIDQLKFLEEQGEITTGTVDRLTESNNILQDPLSTNAEKTQALSTAMDTLYQAGLVTDDEMANFSETTGALNTVLNTGATENEAMAKEILGVKTSSEDADDKLGNYENTVEDTTTATDKLKRELDKAQDKMFDFDTTTSDSNESMKDLNDQIDRFNSTGVQNKSVNVNTNSSSGFGANFNPINSQKFGIKQTGVTPTPTITKKSSINVELNVVSSAIDVETLAKELVEPLRFEIGRVL
jgi:phage-related minor tail protein